MVLWDKFKNSNSYKPLSFTYIDIKGTRYLTRDNNNMFIKEDIYFEYLDWFKHD